MLKANFAAATFDSQETRVTWCQPNISADFNNKISAVALPGKSSGSQVRVFIPLLSFKQVRTFKICISSHVYGIKEH